MGGTWGRAFRFEGARDIDVYNRMSDAGIEGEIRETLSQLLEAANVEMFPDVLTAELDVIREQQEAMRRTGPHEWMIRCFDCCVDFEETYIVTEWEQPTLPHGWLCPRCGVGEKRCDYEQVQSGEGSIS